MFCLPAFPCFPTEKSKVISQWGSLEEAMQTYDKVIPYATRVEELKKLGFSPKDHPNVRTLNHAEVLDPLQGIGPSLVPGPNL